MNCHYQIVHGIDWVLTINIGNGDCFVRDLSSRNWVNGKPKIGAGCSGDQMPTIGSWIRCQQKWRFSTR